MGAGALPRLPADRNACARRDVRGPHPRPRVLSAPPEAVSRAQLTHGYGSRLFLERDPDRPRPGGGVRRHRCARYAGVLSPPGARWWRRPAPIAFIPVVPPESRPPSPQVQDVANQVADVLRRSGVQYPGLSTREIMEAVALAVRQARPEAARVRPRAAAAMAALAAACGAGIVIWRSTGGSLSAVQIAAFGALLLAVISIVRRLSE